jgi:hypothetical protein
MANTDWQSGTDPDALLKHPRGRGGPRRWRLLACGCFRALYGRRVERPETWAAVEAAEGYADGTMDKAGLTAARQRARESGEPSQHVRRAAWWTTFGRPAAAVRGVLRAEYPAAWLTRWDQAPGRPRGPLTRAERTAVCGLIRCMLGGVMQPVEFQPEWRTEAVVGLVRGILADEAYDRCPVLADTLEDAGCNDAQVLGHLRGGGVHVRGCWVVDAVLRLS